MGSGTTILAGEKIGRKVFGLEIDPKYVDVAIQRWESYTKREATLQDGRTYAEVKADRIEPQSRDQQDHSLVSQPQS
jgi:DNA modification methylase